MEENDFKTWAVERRTYSIAGTDITTNSAILTNGDMHLGVAEIGDNIHYLQKIAGLLNESGLKIDNIDAGAIEIEKFILEHEKDLAQESSCEWRNVDDYPISEERQGMEIIAAVSYRINGSPQWWIHHCAIMNDRLVVVSDGQYTLSEWRIKDVQYWQPWVQPPEN